jgi:dimethylhistidine N-methyltransferase
MTLVHTHTIAYHEISKAVAEGLSTDPKVLPSWLFYNEAGDRLFQQIMELPEYYPTRCEYEILKNHKEDLLRYFGDHGQLFQLIEFGAGDGRKTELLLKYLTLHDVKFTYRPVDISASVVDHLTYRLRRNLPALDIQPIVKEYFAALDELHREVRKVILFLGANIGNFTLPETETFLTETANRLSPDDLFLIGFDLKKDPRVITSAYDDRAGITKEFNLNMLKRLNHELGAQFDIACFDHFPVYNPETGRAESFLVSLKDQDVYIESLRKSFHFTHWETIHTEVSQKYDLLMMENMLSRSGFEIVDLFFDNDHYFCDVLVKKTDRS